MQQAAIASLDTYLVISIQLSQETERTRSYTQAKAEELLAAHECKRRRNQMANMVTLLMILLVMLVLAWVAYQIHNPIALHLSKLYLW